MRLRRRVSLTANALLLLGCGGATAPVAGTLQVTLANPANVQVGALMVVLSSPVPPRTVSAGAGLALWGGPVTTTVARLALTGAVTSGTILTLQVDDINKVGEYSVTVVQVADATTLQLQPPSNFPATVTQ